MVTNKLIADKIRARLSGDLTQSELIEWANLALIDLTESNAGSPDEKMMRESLSYIGAGGTSEFPLTQAVYQKLLGLLGPQEAQIGELLRTIVRPTNLPVDKTTELSEEDVPEGLPPSATSPQVTFRPMPHSDRPDLADVRPVWRLRFDLMSANNVSFGLDINGEVIIGRGDDGPNVVDLGEWAPDLLGVSRQHMMLRPTFTNLFALDLDSTNGTGLNGQSIGTNTPYSISDGDVFALGRFQFAVHIIERPRADTTSLSAGAALGDALTEMVKSITSQRELSDVLDQAVEAAMLLSSASEIAVWLVDQQSGNLFLEAERDAADKEIRHTRLQVTDTMVSEVIETGKPLLIKRESDNDENKGATDGHTASLVYIPITLGGITLGVLAASQREASSQIDERNQKVLETIADFAAIAVQNSRRSQATDEALYMRVQELAALNELARAVSMSLDPKEVYGVLTQQVRKHWQIHWVSLWIVDESTQELRVAFDSRGEDGDAAGAPNTATQELVARALQSGEPVLLSDMKAESGEVALDATQEMRSELAVHVKLRDRILGVLDLQSPQLNRFSETDILTLGTVADQLGIAIQNVQLYKEAQGGTQVLEEDVTTHTEELSAANANLEVISRFKDEFVANVSHQLRTPITNLKLIQDAFSQAPARKRQGYLDTMQRETNRLEQIVDDMLRLARMDQGQVTLNATRIDVSQLAHKYVSDRLTMAESRSLTLTANLQSKLPEILVDEELLGQVLSILLTNALNYTPSGGHIEVSTLSQRIERQLRIGISVKDNGPGVTSDEQEHLFERFFRGTAGRESDIVGTGLGLSIAKEIMELHGGTLEVNSEGQPGWGATFTMWLPLAGGQTANLLLADDEEIMLDVMQELLSAYGHNVLAVGSAHAAMDVLQSLDMENLPDIIITDVVMPKMSGIELLKAVRNNPQWADIPFLFISASTTLSMEGQIAAFDNIKFLRKPFDSETLQETVTTMLQTLFEQPN